MADRSPCSTPGASLKLEPLYFFKKKEKKGVGQEQRKKKTGTRNVCMSTGAYFANKAEMKL